MTALIGLSTLKLKRRYPVVMGVRNWTELYRKPKMSEGFFGDETPLSLDWPGCPLGAVYDRANFPFRRKPRAHGALPTASRRSIP